MPVVVEGHPRERALIQRVNPHVPPGGIVDVHRDESAVRAEARIVILHRAAEERAHSALRVYQCELGEVPGRVHQRTGTRHRHARKTQGHGCHGAAELDRIAFGSERAGIEPDTVEHLIAGHEDQRAVSRVPRASNIDVEQGLSLGGLEVEGVQPPGPAGADIGDHQGGPVAGEEIGQHLNALARRGVRCGDAVPRAGAGSRQMLPSPAVKMMSPDSMIALYAVSGTSGRGTA